MRDEVIAGVVLEEVCDIDRPVTEDIVIERVMSRDVVAVSK